MNSSLRRALVQRYSPGPPGPGRPARHRRRRGVWAALAARSTTAKTVSIFLASAAVAALLAGGGWYLAGQAATPQPHHETLPRPAVARSSASPSPSPSSVAPVPGSAGDYQVADHWFTVTEAPDAGLGARILQVEVRYPVIARLHAPSRAATGGFPLVVFAPGYRQCGAVYSDLLTQWASAGYVVAVVNFPLTNCQIANPDESDLVHQPQDVATVIGWLQRQSGQSYSPLAGLIDASRVAVAGHSDGGDTVAAMAAMSCCRYPGLRAAIVLAGAEWPAFTGRWFAAPTPPMLFAQGTNDSWNPPAASMRLYQADLTGTRYYLNLFGSDHFAPYEGAATPEPIVERVTIDFLDQYLEGAGDESAGLQTAGNVPGLARLVSSGGPP
jgi:dienelactone hydrolase